MFAYDPKRTLAFVAFSPFQSARLTLYDLLSQAFGEGNETARVHQSACWLGSSVAACGARTAAGADAAYWCVIGLTEDTEGQARVAALKRGLEQAGWVNGKNARIEVFWAGGDTDLTRRYAAELVASSPDVIVVNAPVGMVELQKETKTLPIVFVHVSNVTESGLIVNPARPELTSPASPIFSITGSRESGSNSSRRSHRT